MGTAFGDGAKMSDIISKIPSSMLVNDTSDAAQVNKALLNQVQGSNKIIDAVNTVNAAVTAVGSGIVELGTNSTGTYIKWGNGLMMCEGATGAISHSTAHGALYYGLATVILPQTFISFTGVTATPKYNNDGIVSATYRNLTTTQFDLVTWSTDSAGSSSVYWVVWGKWK